MNVTEARGPPYQVGASLLHVVFDRQFQERVALNRISFGFEPIVVTRDSWNYATKKAALRGKGKRSSTRRATAILWHCDRIATEGHRDRIIIKDYTSLLEESSNMSDGRHCCEAPSYHYRLRRRNRLEIFNQRSWACLERQLGAAFKGHPPTGVGDETRREPREMAGD